MVAVVRHTCLRWTSVANVFVSAKSVLVSRPACCLHRGCACCLQKDGSEKPVSDQWLDPFVIVGEDDKPVGTIEDGERPSAAR